MNVVLSPLDNYVIHCETEDERGVKKKERFTLLVVISKNLFRRNDNT